MTCHHCGIQIPDDSVFCPKCGTKVDPTAPDNVIQQTTNKEHRHAQDDARQEDDTNYQRDQRRKGIILLVIIIAIALIVHGINSYGLDNIDNTIRKVISPTPSAAPTTTMSATEKKAEAASQWMSDHPKLNNIGAQCSGYINFTPYNVLDHRLPNTGLNQFIFSDGLLIEKGTGNNSDTHDKVWMCVAQALGMDINQSFAFVIEIAGGAFAHQFDSNNPETLKSSLANQAPRQLGSGIEARSSIYIHIDGKNYLNNTSVAQTYVFLSDGVTTNHEMLDSFLGSASRSSDAPSSAASPQQSQDTGAELTPEPHSNSSTVDHGSPSDAIGYDKYKDYNCLFGNSGVLAPCKEMYALMGDNLNYMPFGIENKQADKGYIPVDENRNGKIDSNE